MTGSVARGRLHKCYMFDHFSVYPRRNYTLRIPYIGSTVAYPHNSFRC